MNIKYYLIFVGLIYHFWGLCFTAEELKKHVKDSLYKAEKHQSKLNEDILNVQGLTGHKVRYLLNNLCSLKNANYLEIGVYNGSTFIAANYKNQDVLKSSIAIDNWAFGSKNTFVNNTRKFLDLSKFHFYESDCFSLNLQEKFKNKIDIYFYDGEHNFDDQFKAFTYFNEVLEDNFIAIVDDYNWPVVQRGTKEAFLKLNYNVVFEVYLQPDNDSDKAGWRDGVFDSGGWWNGIYIAVISKSNV